MTARRIEGDWPDLMQRLEHSEGRFVQGDAAAYKELWARTDDVVVMGAFGGVERGWHEVSDRLDWAASRGASQGYEFEVLAEYVSEHMGCRVGLQHYANGRTLRVTEVFTKQPEWRLVHRHADWLVPRGDRTVMR